MRNSYQKLQLPNNYASLLLQSEIQVKLGNQPIQNNLCKLLELYSIGFEYYESIGSYKFQYFQIRMKEVFQQQQAQNQKMRTKLSLLSKDKENHNAIRVLSEEQTKIIEKKCRDQQRVTHLKEIQDRTSVKSTSEEIKALLLSGDYKAIDVYTKVKFEMDMQEKVLEQKLQQRRRKSLRNSSKDKLLKLNSTKTSLLSQEGRKGEYLKEIKQNIFEKFINENENDEEEIFNEKEAEDKQQEQRKKEVFQFISM